jgi:hypothetical protein
MRHSQTSRLHAVKVYFRDERSVHHIPVPHKRRWGLLTGMLLGMRYGEEKVFE